MENLISDFSAELSYLLVGGFLLIVFVQWLARTREAKKIGAMSTCPNCDGGDFSIDIHVLNTRSGNRVSLLRNIGGTYLALGVGGVLLWLAYQQISDLIAGTNITGIHDESLKAKLAFIWTPSLLGGTSILLGALLLKDLFIGKKEKVINLCCLTCAAEYSLDGEVLKETKRGKTIDLIRGSSKSGQALGESPAGSEITDDGSQDSQGSSHLCPNCGNSTDVSDLTCSQCGHTQWGVIGCMGVVSLGAAAFIIVRIFNSNTTGLLFWIAAILGTIILGVTVQSIIQAVKGRKAKNAG